MNGKLVCNSAASSLIQTILQRAVPYQATGSRHHYLTDRLVRVCRQDYRPFSIANDKGFADFVRDLDARYQMSSQFTLKHQAEKLSGMLVMGISD